ncbi:hypothetical protein K2173_023484 [Erythroxylum novogranatense]|uniref:Uncharacterized protein n=1 Tax=Erythroxylum novogranatense TaxID=1862640 RepID=A0AAV8TYQ3_9ROSI|nr:hypothetical protein K2173_023484 [Erythroxylum novogranatense]
MPSGSYREVTGKSLEVTQDDKFFSRIMSKETSMANSSSRVYYTGTSGAIPFLWETRPGTPKHPSAHSSVPPLTPPPSYYSTSKANSTDKSVTHNLLRGILLRLASKRIYVSPSRSMSSSASSSSSLSLWSSVSSSPANFRNSKRKRERRLSFSRPPVHWRVNDVFDDELDTESAEPTLGSGLKRTGFRGFYLVGNMKSVLLAIVGHGSTYK